MHIETAAFGKTLDLMAMCSNLYINRFLRQLVRATNVISMCSRNFAFCVVSRYIPEDFYSCFVTFANLRENFYIFNVINSNFPKILNFTISKN